MTRRGDSVLFVDESIAFANMSRQSVVEAGDVLEIRIGGDDGVLRYTVTPNDLRRAFARIDLDPQAFVPPQTRLLQNYPNPFNP